MAGLQSISCEIPSDFSSEKKLAMILKTLLVPEAAAKVAFIVSGLPMQKGSLLRLPGINYNHVYCNSAEIIMRVAENYKLCGSAGSIPPFIYATGW